MNLNSAIGLPRMRKMKTVTRDGSSLKQYALYIMAGVLIAIGGIVAMAQWPGGNARCEIDEPCISIGPPEYGSAWLAGVGIALVVLGVLVAAATWSVGRRRLTK